VRDLTIKTLTGLAGKEAFDGVYAAAAELYADHLPLAQAKLAHADAEETRKAKLHEVIAAADVVIGAPFLSPFAPLGCFWSCSLLVCGACGRFVVVGTAGQ
jgi:hypothetical protein